MLKAQTLTVNWFFQTWLLLNINVDNYSNCMTIVIDYFKHIFPIWGESHGPYAYSEHDMV